MTTFQTVPRPIAARSAPDRRPSGGTVPTVLADRLGTARQRAFVGRHAELAVVEEALSGCRGAVVYVQGPGGVGKTTLLRRVAGLGQQAGRRVVWLAAADLAALPAGPLPVSVVPAAQPVVPAAQPVERVPVGVGSA